MRFLYVLSALAALAYAAPGANDAVGSLSLEKRQCLPSSCKSQGVSNNQYFHYLPPRCLGSCP